MEEKRKKGKLPRLPGHYYRGKAYGSWTYTLEARETGWLTPEFHLRFRELQLHALCRYDLVCPVYCLMPDHIHHVWIGISDRADQQLAVRFFRQRLNDAFPPGTHFQKQPHDHMLRENERERAALLTHWNYILENPVRAGLVATPAEYPYTGALIPGFPDLPVGGEDGWKRFWICYNAYIERFD